MQPFCNCTTILLKHVTFRVILLPERSSEKQCTVMVTNPWACSCANELPSTLESGKEWNTNLEALLLEDFEASSGPVGFSFEQKGLEDPDLLDLFAGWSTPPPI